MKKRVAQLSVCVASVLLWGAAVLGDMRINQAGPKEEVAVKDQGALDAAKLEMPETAPKYTWEVKTTTDKTLMGTHASVGSKDENCDLSPGWECEREAVAGPDGKVSVPVRWRRPVGDSLKEVVASHMNGERVELGAEGVAVSGFEPGAKVKYKVSMGVYTRAEGEADNIRRVYRSDAGLVDCFQACLLMFSEFKPVEAPSEPMVAKPPPAPHWIESHWPSGWMTLIPSLCLLLFAAAVGPVIRARNFLRVILGLPGPLLKLKARGNR